MPWRRVPVTAYCALVVAILVAGVERVLANRCDFPPSGGIHCTCPDYPKLLHDPQSHVKCRPGWVPVVYTLDAPFPPDGARSSMTVDGLAGSECNGLVQTSSVSGAIVGCWSAIRPNGCRSFVIARDAVCLQTDVPLAPGKITSLVAIGNAGAGPIEICPPRNPAQSCRGTTGRRRESMRFYEGGLCATVGCTAGKPTPNVCEAGWGATYWGYTFSGDGVRVPPGWYDWQSGGFKVVNHEARPGCGQLETCVGDRVNFWTFQAVATPAPGFAPPCFGTAANRCEAPGCFR